MELKFISHFSHKYPIGFKVVVDKIRYEPQFAGRYAVRVVSTSKRPQWLAIEWFIKGFDDMEKMRRTQETPDVPA